MKELGITEPQVEDSLKVTSGLMSEETQVVILEIAE